MNILLTLYPNSVMYTKTMLLSLFLHNKEHLNIYIFHARLKYCEINQLVKFIKKYGHSVNIIEIEEKYFKDAPLYRGCTKEIYYRLLAMEKLPNDVKKVLYMDIDIIVNNSLNEFYNTEFDNKYFVVCEDSNHSRNNDELYDILNIPKEKNYFNSGVLLFNLDLLRKTNQTTKIRKFMRGNWSKKNKWFHDQNILNSMYYDCVKYKEYILFNCLIKNVPDEKKEFCLKNSSIFHFAGIKPWNYKYPSKCYKIWWKYAIRAGYFGKYLKFWIRHKFYMMFDCKEKKCIV